MTQKPYQSLWGSTYLYDLYKRVPPHPPSPQAFSPWQFLGMYFYSCEIVELTVKFNRSIFHQFNFIVKYSFLLIFNSQMTMSSDKLATIRQPTVTVNFDVDESGQDRHISVELTNDELKHLISSLEAANKVGSRT